MRSWVVNSVVWAKGGDAGWKWAKGERLGDVCNSVNNGNFKLKKSGEIQGPKSLISFASSA